MKAYKGFNKDMTCLGFQFKEGKTYEEKEAKLCEKGFHACLNPIDVFKYYPPVDSIYHSVEIDDDDVSKECGGDSKICGKKIKIGAKLTLREMIQAGVKIDIASASGDSSHAATSGDYSPAATSGVSSPAATSGVSSHAATSGFSSPLPRRAIPPLQRLLAKIQKQNLPLETGLFLRNTANGMVKHIQYYV